MTHSDQCARYNTEALECILRKTDLIGADNRSIVNDIERRRNSVFTGDDFDFGERLKTSDSVHQAITVEINDVFEIGIDRNAF